MLGACVFVCVCVCVCVSLVREAGILGVCVSVCVFVCTYTHIRVCVFVGVCTYTHTYTHTGRRRQLQVLSYLAQDGQNAGPFERLVARLLSSWLFELAQEELASWSAAGDERAEPLDTDQAQILKSSQYSIVFLFFLDKVKLLDADKAQVLKSPLYIVTLYG